MKPSKILVYLALFSVLACGDNSNAEAKPDSNASQDTNTITPKTIENIDYADYALSTEAETVVSEWEKYQELAIQITYLKKGDLSFFTSERDLVIDFVKEFQDNVPEGLKTNPVNSRVSVVVTAILKLNDDLTLDNIELQNKLNSIKKLLVAFSNLNFQINKKLERDLYDDISPE